MKKWISLLIVTLGLCSALSANEKETKAKELYKEALKLEQEGKILQAISNLKLAIHYAPNFTQARNQYIRMDRIKDTVIYKTRIDHYNKIIVPKIQMEDDTLDDALMKLSIFIQEHNKANDTKYVSNFVVVDREKKLEKYRIKLNLSNVPIKVALDNIMMLSSANYSLKEYVIEVRHN